MGIDAGGPALRETAYRLTGGDGRRADDLVRFALDHATGEDAAREALIRRYVGRHRSRLATAANVLRYWDGLSAAEIARVLDCSVDTVTRLLERERGPRGGRAHRAAIGAVLAVLVAVGTVFTIHIWGAPDRGDSTPAPNRISPLRLFGASITSAPTSTQSSLLSFLNRPGSTPVYSASGPIQSIFGADEVYLVTPAGRWGWQPRYVSVQGHPGDWNATEMLTTGSDALPTNRVAGVFGRAQIRPQAVFNWFTGPPGSQLTVTGPGHLRLRASMPAGAAGLVQRGHPSFGAELRYVVVDRHGTTVAHGSF